MLIITILKIAKFSIPVMKKKVCNSVKERLFVERGREIEAMHIVGSIKGMMLQSGEISLGLVVNI